jgi:hypothetical protein
MRVTNHDRADRAAQLLRLSAPRHEDAVTTAIRVLEELRHWCDRADLDFGELVDLSHVRYLEHLAEGAADEPASRPAGGAERPAA